MKVKCPTCRNKTEWNKNPYRPFCSERCKLLDLGAWSSEEYRITGKLDDESGQEYFLITNSVLTDYYFILHRKNKKTGKTFSRNFHYKITPARWDDNESYKPLYPEDLEKE